MKSHLLGLLAISLLAFSAAQAQAEFVTLTKLTGVTGGTPTATAVYRADLSTVSLSSILMITLYDVSGGSGGYTGQLSGFDLDAIKLSDTSVDTAVAAAALVGLPDFDFTTAGTTFAPGTQRAPIEAKLYGTGPAGNTVNNAVATLGTFDGNSTIVIPAAFGFVSMGDGGVLTFKLTVPVSTAGKYLYIGECGNNGELAALVAVNLPEPSSIALASVGLVAMVGGAWRLRRPARA